MDVSTKGERGPSGRGIGENGADKRFVEAGEGLFGGAPGFGGDGFERTKPGRDPGTERRDVGAKR